MPICTRIFLDVLMKEVQKMLIRHQEVRNDECVCIIMQVKGRTMQDYILRVTYKHIMLWYDRVSNGNSTCVGHRDTPLTLLYRQYSM